MKCAVMAEQNKLNSKNSWKCSKYSFDKCWLEVTARQKQSADICRILSSEVRGHRT